MKTFTIPTREQVTPANQAIFDNLKNMIGFVPNLYATFAHSDHALGNFLTLQNSKTSINAKEREVLNLVVSEINDCSYCLSAHTVFAKKNGFTDEQIIEIRKAEITFDPKLAILAQLAKSITENKGHADAQLLTEFYEAGYNEGNLVDIIMIIGDKVITNYLHAVTEIPVDWPLAPSLK
ncbi:putative peroxidase-related enzyme [Pedobacter cryoconitis]|uniref:Putative peroxidase-related enzyme n=1 Tax=Pedobacter cryoconitis TaxID=188932 RepID=A0A7W9DX50_9SPHI|nr:carboxymuconolactone decarboxylase family protein [Pedobacter cryoconitis]MBB5634747.1 putative peroxidase-related enzyme [Pedobacter cryoconitis]